MKHISVQSQVVLFISHWKTFFDGSALDCSDRIDLKPCYWSSISAPICLAMKLNVWFQILLKLYYFKFKLNQNCSLRFPYHTDLTILNGVEATNPIDVAFRDNYAKDPQLLWQYFGSADGFYRSFPGKKMLPW